MAVRRLTSAGLRLCHLFGHRVLLNRQPLKGQERASHANSGIFAAKNACENPSPTWLASKQLVLQDRDPVNGYQESMTVAYSRTVT